MIGPSRLPSTRGPLTDGWRWTLGLAWFGVIAGFSVVSRSSRELGLPTWWLGPSSAPQPYPLIALPFLVPAAVVALTFTRTRWTPWAALGAGVVLLLVGVGDLLGDYPGFGIVEIALAGAGGAVGAVSFTGRTRGQTEASRPAEDALHRAPGQDETMYEDDGAAGR